MKVLVTPHLIIRTTSTPVFNHSSDYQNFIFLRHFHLPTVHTHYMSANHHLNVTAKSFGVCLRHLQAVLDCFCNTSESLEHLLIKISQVLHRIHPLNNNSGLYAAGYTKVLKWLKLWPGLHNWNTVLDLFRHTTVYHFHSPSAVVIMLTSSTDKTLKNFEDSRMAGALEYGVLASL